MEPASDGARLSSEARAPPIPFLRRTVLTARSPIAHPAGVQARLPLSRATRSLIVASALGFLATGTGCRSTPEEPASRSPAALSAASDGPSSPAVATSARRDDPTRGQRLDQASCDTATRHVNRVYGREESDARGKVVTFHCMQSGNRQWYDCVMGASTQDAVATCGRKHLIAPAEPR
ncbi:MAG TPA: hypothetical protein PLI95_07450 [Polyangiaceae bacterium]|nr:hypothetical protein [Polyangiaceae bacterium]